MASIIFGAFIVIGVLFTSCSGAAIQRQPSGMALWPRNPNAKLEGDTYTVPLVRIGYQLKSTYFLTEYNTLKSVMDKLAKQTKNCIKFDLYNPLDPSMMISHPLHIRKSPVEAPIIPRISSTVCNTLSGYTDTGPANSQAQTMVVFAQTDATPGGCLKDERDLMRYFLNVLGVGNEYQRADREVGALTMDPNYRNLVADSLKTDNILDINMELDALTEEVDINSVTMIAGSRYAKSASSPLFRLKGGRRVPTIAQLSQLDCQTLRYLYDCNIDCPEDPITVPPLSGGWTPSTLNASLNCWPEDQTGTVSQLEFENGIGLLGTPVRPTVPVGVLFIEIGQLSGLGAAADDIVVNRHDPNTATTQAQLSLRRKISSQLSTEITLIGRQTAEGPFAVEGQIAININCYPRFRCCGRDVTCQTDEGPGSNKDTCNANSVVAITAECVDGKIPTQFVFGPVQAIDPDGGKTEFIGPVISISLSGDGGWTMHAASGNLVRSGNPVDPGQFAFTFTYFDAQVYSVKKLHQIVNIECVPTAVDGKTASDD